MEEFKKKHRLKAIIVDDVKLIRTELIALLKEHQKIEVIGEASNGKEAIEVIKKLNPDVVFLDIHMTKYSGFDVLNKVENKFQLIFISSYDKFLPEAQHYNAVDFLMKPINKNKLLIAVEKLQST
jgi:two-component system, LytTR family, response regulator